MLTKTEICRKYRNELKKIRDVKIRDTKHLRFIERLELSLAREFLIMHPELNDKDCSGRGLPAFDFKKLTQG